MHAVRPHLGQNLVAQRLRALLVSSLYPSTISESHVNCGKIQDAYSLRCIPQVRRKANQSRQIDREDWISEQRIVIAEKELQ